VGRTGPARRRRCASWRRCSASTGRRGDRWLLVRRNPTTCVASWVHAGLVRCTTT
jgi:hypothetical protein